MADFRGVSFSCGYFFSGRPRTKKPHETDSLVFFRGTPGPKMGLESVCSWCPDKKKMK